jgi:hypothetical protein
LQLGKLRLIDMNTEINSHPVQHLKCIRCPDCGEEILMVPVLSEMIEAIENHISTHKDHNSRLSSNLPLSHPSAPQLREDLTEQVLTRAAEISDALNRNQTWINHQ